MIEVVDGPIADDGLALARHRDMTIRLDPVDLGVSARVAAIAAAFGLPVTGDQRIGMDLGRPARRHRIAAGDVGLRVLLPLDPRISLHLQRQVLARRVQKLGRKATTRHADEKKRQAKNHCGGVRRPAPIGSHR